MNIFLVISVFTFSFFILSWSSSGLVKNLVHIAKYLQWKEFIIAFFVMGIAVSMPNFFVDFNAAIQGKPELAFGDIVGSNIVNLTIVLAIATFFSKKGISSKSDMVQDSAIFTLVIAILPLFLALDKNLSRLDGLILISAFIIYSAWLFSKRERFKKVYHLNDYSEPVNIVEASKKFKFFLKNLFRVVIFLIILLVTSQVIVSFAQSFSDSFGISLASVGILIIGLGNCFPEIYFSIISAKEEKNWLVLGDLMGAVIVPATLVLGLVAFVFPFEITDMSPFLVARIFLIIAAIFSFIVIKTGKEITKKEGLFLLGIYITFLITEILIR